MRSCLAIPYQKMCKCVPIVALDPQANATNSLLNRMSSVYRQKPKLEETLFESIKNKKLSDALKITICHNQKASVIFLNLHRSLFSQETFL